MPTKKPRLTITLDPVTHELLKELAEVNEQSLSSVISELLDTMIPTVQRVVEAGRHFQLLSEDMKAQIRRNFDAAESLVLPEVAAMESDFIALLNSVGEAAAAEADPRPVTRGSRPPHPRPHPDDEEAIS